MMPTIRVDDDVYEALAKRGKVFVDTPNTVLRGILQLPDRRPADGAVPKSGALMPLVEAGELQPGDALIWPRRTTTYHATVTTDGRLRIGDDTFDTPSAAAQSLTGYNVNGWKEWRRASDGCRIQDLRRRGNRS